MTNGQIEWAAQHDWFVKAEDGKVFVNEVSRSKEGLRCEEIITFSGFKDLRDWAGY